jgi:hypothetical protein
MHLKRMLRTSGIVVVASLSFATASHADSVIVGTVLDARTKQPLENVSVTATSPYLGGEQLVVTDTEGQYRIPQLPPGTYRLRFDKEGFEPFARSEIALRLDRTLKVDVELREEGYIDAIYGGVPRTVVVGSNTTGQELAPDFTRRIAVNRPEGKAGAARSFEALAELVPNTQSDPYGVSIHGASPLENGYVVDGLSTQDPVFGFNASPLSVEFLQDIEVLTGGHLPEHGRATGGILRARTRYGSNEFHGSVFGHWVPGLLASRAPSVSNQTSTLSGQNALENLGDVGATLGGPLVRDRLWFFAGVAPSLTRLEHSHTVNTPVVGTSRTYLADERRLQALGKLTYLINPYHNVSLSFITTPTRSGGADQLTVDPLTGRIPEVLSGRPGAVGQLVQDSNSTTAGLEYAGTLLDRRLLLDAHLGWSHQTTSDALADGATSSGLADLSLHTHEADRYQANALVTWRVDFGGPHIFKGGVDAEHLASVRTRTRSGGVVLGGGAISDSQTYRYTSNLLGAFVQDSWVPFREGVTVNAGVRYDAQWLYQEDGRLAFALLHQLSPRIGLVVDPLNNHRLKLSAHYAKYHGMMPLGLMELAFPPPSISQFQLGGTSGQEPVDPTIAPLSSSELVAGAEYELFPKIRVSATYTHRRLDSAITEMSRAGATPFFLGNPGVGSASDFPEAERTQDAVTVAVNRTFGEGWVTQASYTWSRLYGNYLGPFRPVSIEGRTSFQREFLTPDQMENRTGLLPYDRTHTFKLFGARELQFTRELSASLGLSYLGRSGTPINYLGGHPLLGEGETFVLPRGSSGERTPWVHVIDSNLGVNYRLGKGGQTVSFTLDVFNLFNFQQATRVDETYTYEAVLPLKDVNAGDINPRMITKVNANTGAAEPLTSDDLNGNFKKPLQYQTPRQVRLGIRYSF